jgi:hypothetical protein
MVTMNFSECAIVEVDIHVGSTAMVVAQDQDVLMDGSPVSPLLSHFHAHRPSQFFLA